MSAGAVRHDRTGVRGSGNPADQVAGEGDETGRRDSGRGQGRHVMRSCVPCGTISSFGSVYSAGTPPGAPYSDPLGGLSFSAVGGERTVGAEVEAAPTRALWQVGWNRLWPDGI